MTSREEQVVQAIDHYREHGRPPEGFLAEGFELHQAETITGTAGLFKGQGALRAALEELAVGFEGLNFELARVEEQPDGRVAVGVRVTGRGRSSGIDASNTVSWLWSFEGAQATRLQVFEDPEGAFNAGSEPGS
jgi:ketosteroid isomerase-like protein